MCMWILGVTPPIWQPMVRVHPETGATSLYISPIYNDAVEGMDEAESKELLDRLNDFEKSLREKSKREVPKSNTKVRPESTNDEFETLPVDGAHTAPLTQGNTPNVESRQEFGEYLLLEMLGRGGMGVVFRAQEKKTGRKVALKMIRSNIVNRVDEETQRVVIERFQTEA